MVNRLLTFNRVKSSRIERCLAWPSVVEALLSAMLDRVEDYMSMQAPEISMTETGRGFGDSESIGSNQAINRQSFPAVPQKLRRPIDRTVGFVLIALCALGAISLATWTISDPSLTFANGSTPDNWLGFWGASFSDFTMQFLGFGSIVFLVPPLIWGLFKVSNRQLGRLLPRLGFWLGGVSLLCAALACFSIPEGWPLQVGLGGVVGDAVLSVPRAFSGTYPEGFVAVIISVLFCAPAIWMLLKACNMAHGLPAKLSSQESKADEVLVMERELNDGFSDDDLAENEGWDWAALIAMPVGLVMHVGYRVSSMLRKRRQHSAQTGAQPRVRMEPVAVDGPANFQAPDDALLDDGAIHHSYDAELESDQFEDEAPVNRPNELTRTRVEAPGMDEDEPIPHTDAAQPAAPAPRVSKRVTPKKAGGKFQMPALDLLSEQKSIVDDPSLSNEALEENARVLEGVLEDFGVKGQILKVRPGPVVTLYELEPAPGVKSSRVIGLAEDIARSMSAIAARVAVVPGRNAIGIELPNKRRETVYLREQLSSKEFKQTKAKLAMCLGKNIGGEPVIADLAKMPHLLMAGTTGSGKSVGINTMILSLLYRLGPDKCKMIMIDPKMLELSIYDGIPHLLTPVVVDPKKAVVALKWTVREMEERYKKMSKVGVRNIDGFNNRVAEAEAKGEVITRTVQTGFDRDTGEAIYEHEELDLEAMPFIVVIIDEMADLMMVAGKDIEGTVQRLAQMARAAGIHVIMATQRPSVDVITGTIKANFPTRISFQVTSKIDSRTILGEMGAEQLLGMGDMLYMAGGGRITRVHGPFVDDQEVEDVVNHLKAQGVPQYLEAVTEEDEEEEQAAAAAGGGSGGMSDSDDPYDRAVAIVLHDRKASTSYIQRRLSVGYNKAASLIERMEQEGLISPANHAGKREILVPAEDEVM